MSTKVKNWKTDKMVQACKEAAVATGGRVAMLIVVSPDGILGWSYGVTGSLCRIGGEMLDVAINALETAE